MGECLTLPASLSWLRTSAINGSFTGTFAILDTRRMISATQICPAGEAVASSGCGNAMKGKSENTAEGLRGPKRRL